MIGSDYAKSSYSFANNNCAEARFAKSRHSLGNGDCVETACHCGVVDVRDSKAGEDGPILTVSPAAWEAFLAGVKAGELVLDR